MAPGRDQEGPVILFTQATRQALLVRRVCFVGLGSSSIGVWGA